MNIPYEMQEATEKLLEKRSISKIRDCVSLICDRYNKESGQGKVLVKTEEEAESYALSRMPGTYGAVKTAVMEFKAALEGYFEEHPEEVPKTLADIGAGTGAAVWAVDSEMELESITCVEREDSMIAIGKHMLSFGSEVMRKAAWIKENAASENKDGSRIKADLVTASYIMNELKAEDRDRFLENLWETSEKAIILLEPGTKAGYLNIMYAREYFIKNGGIVAAPCTHSEKCPLSGGDWCHFTCRMQRSKVQKFVKGGDAPYEDEKFSYIAVLKGKDKEDIDPKTDINGTHSRIIRHPIINKGCVEIKTCSANGINEMKITSRDKTVFKQARKAEWGDIWD